MLDSTAITALFHNCESGLLFPQSWVCGSGYNGGVKKSVRGHTRTTTFVVCAFAVLSAIAVWFAVTGFQMDLFSFYEGWRLTASGASPYINHTDAYSRAFPDGHMTMLRYPPAFFALWPIAMMSYATVKVVWYVALLACIIAQVAVAWRCFGVRSAAIMAGLCLTWPMIWALECGQTDIIVGAMLAMFAVLYLSDRKRWSAIPLAVAITLKTVPALLLIYLAARRDWRTLAIVVGITAVLSIGGAATAVSRSPVIADDYFAVMAHPGGYGGSRADRVGVSDAVAENYLTFEGRGYRYGLAGIGTYMSVSLASVTGVSAKLLIPIAVLLLAAFSWRGRADMALAAFLLAYCILNPVAWGTGFVVAIPAIVIAYRAGLGRAAVVFGVLAAVVMFPRIGPWDWHGINEAARCAAVIGMILILAAQRSQHVEAR